MKISHEKYSSDFPPQEYHVSSTPEGSSIDTLRKIVETDGNETAIDNFLKNNTSVLANCLNFTQLENQGVRFLDFLGNWINEVSVDLGS